MSLVSGAIPNFVSGISQQAYALRLASQAEDQVNMWPSVVTGLDKRPPTEFAAKLSNSPPTNAFLHLINRDLIERYFVVIAGGTLKVYRLDGTEVSVAFPDGSAYLAGTSFAATTIADFTFIVNRDVPTAMAGTTAPTRIKEALITVKVGNYSTDYSASAFVNGTGYSFGFTTSATSANEIRTNDIAARLTAGINAWGSGLTAVQSGSTIYVSHPTLDFTIVTSDSYGDQGLQTIKGKVAAAALLPGRATNGFIVEVEGQPGNRFDNLFLQYQDTDTASGAGIWREVPQPGRLIRFDAATLPHILVREAGGTFTFRRATWADCRVGDTNNVPVPGWIGRKISDVFFYRNRLGVIAGEQVGMSQSGKYFNFWRETAAQLLDSDPIDVSVAHVKVSDLRWAVPFNETLLLFSDQTQFIDNSGSPLSPATVDFRPVTELEAAVTSRPLGLGSFVYFGAPNGGYTSVREYFLDGSSRLAQANDITGHVPRLISGTILDMAVSSTQDCAFVLASGARNQLWFYKFAYSGQEKVQSAWARWEFPNTDTILAADFIQSSLYLVISRPDGLFLERVDLDPGRALGALSWVPKMDRLIIGSRATTVSYDAGTDKTTFTLPFDATALSAFVIDVNGPAGRKPGETITPERPSSGQVRLTGNWSATAARNSVVFGVPFVATHRFSTLLVRQAAAGGGLSAVTEGRLQLGQMRVNFVDSGYFRAEVTPFRRQTYRYPFSGRVVGSARTQIGAPASEEGVFTFPIRTNNMEATISLINDSPYPSRFLSAEWTGDFSPRARRVD